MEERAAIGEMREEVAAQWPRPLMGPCVPSQEALKSPETKEMLCLGGDEEPPRPM